MDTQENQSVRIDALEEWTSTAVAMHLPSNLEYNQSYYTLLMLKA